MEEGRREEAPSRGARGHGRRERDVTGGMPGRERAVARTVIQERSRRTTGEDHGDARDWPGTSDAARAGWRGF